MKKVRENKRQLRAFNTAQPTSRTESDRVQLKQVSNGTVGCAESYVCVRERERERKREKERVDTCMHTYMVACMNA